ncbi:MAG TPA: FIST N-terminal domain-containing protein [Hyphomicrobiaceae bacterium]|nr:FIST N-terminal domain-containing protein [Hyphomicrobiaceae bacterium]
MYSPAHHAKLIGELFAKSFPDAEISGCSTSGEITPFGMMQGGIVALAFPETGFRVEADVIADVDRSGVEHATELARKLKLRFGSGQPMRNRVFALLLVDGLSNAEEMLIAAVHWAMDDVQLIGGSAGDDLAFRETSLLHKGHIIQHAALLILVESDFPFEVFKTQNFEPTGTKLVVTAADTQKRIVYELNAEPAAQEYAAAIGLLTHDLGPFSFASYPLVVRVGGDYYCRSIRNMNQDGSLTFFCAIDEGLVFTVATPQDMVQSTLLTLQRVEQSLGRIDTVLGFDCILRRLDAENRQTRHQLADIYRRFNVVGFHTYGEQFNAMHLNQTLTGIAFGAPPAKTSA